MRGLFRDAVQMRIRSMIVATHNVNGVNGRLPRLIEWLHNTQPDIACLQELRTDDTKFPIASIRAAGYHAIWHGQRAHHGVAILAKRRAPIESRRGMPGDPSDGQARFIEAHIEGLRVASIYLPNGNPISSANYEYKRRWFARFVAYAARIVDSKECVILAGDLNVVPTDFDIYNANRWRFDAVMQPAIQSQVRALLAQGWIDAARSVHPRDPMYSYWIDESDYRNGKGWRLDFILLNARAGVRLVEAGVDGAYRLGIKPSDHAPVWIRLAD